MFTQNLVISTLLRAAVFALSAALILLLWTLLTFELPPQPVTAAWQERASSHVALLVVIAACGFVGSAIGFALLPRGSALRRKATVALGFIFAVLGFGAIPLADAIGIGGAAAAAAILAAGTAYFGARAFLVRP